MDKNLEEKLKSYGLSVEEYEKAKGIVGGELTQIHWALFSSLWSEHCSYKSSKIHLKNLYNDSKKLVSEDGENAGVVDLGEGERVAFKMESHNHPSFIEPFQGAATGVGGILRDIFTMGARPIALANYLCFGEKGSDRLEQLIEGVVSGISFYGNCVGVATVTGQTEFDKSYNTNNLVNAFALGYYGKDDEITSSKVKTPGLDVVYVGAKTGKDGVHGASMASESFDEDSESKRPTIQIGDPFYEKCLIESCLEVLSKGLVESMQDMGAAGLTSSSFEMSFGGGRGLDIDLSKVPLRDSSMGPEEILLSESQERMLLVCKPENLEEIVSTFSKWGLDAVKIGTVREEKEIKLKWNNELICEIDPAKIVDGAPRYDRPYKKIEAVDVDSAQTSDYDLSTALSSTQGSSRKWIYKQYDQRVGARTQADCDSPLGIIRLPESGRELGMVLGCRPAVMRINARLGGFDSFLSPALQLQIKGFTPWAVTDCLNFGNPQKEHIMGEFVSSLEAMSEACRVYEAPIISGNVSFYNETENQNITSTPATGVVGLKESKDFKTPASVFQKTGSKILMFSCQQVIWSGYGAEVVGDKTWVNGELNPEMVKDFGDSISELVKEGKVLSSRLVSKFGISYALSKMVTSDIGFESELDGEGSEFWNEEEMYQVLLEVEEKDVNDFMKNPYFNTVLGVTESDGSLHYDNNSYTYDQINKVALEAWGDNFEGLE